MTQLLQYVDKLTAPLDEGTAVDNVTRISATRRMPRYMRVPIINELSYRGSLNSCFMVPLLADSYNRGRWQVPCQYRGKYTGW